MSHQAILWLEFHSSVGCSVRGPFAMEDQEYLLKGIFKAANVVNIEISDMAHNSEYISTDRAHRIKVKVENNPLVAQVLSQYISKTFNLYTIRPPVVEDLPELKSDRETDGLVLRPYVMSGEEFFGLGDSVETFVSEQKALSRSKELQDLNIGNEGDWQFRCNPYNYPINVGNGNYGAQRYEERAYTSVAAKIADHKVADLVTVTEVFVHNYSKAGYAQLLKSNKPFQITPLNQ
jgi:hypothetical protein